MNDDGDLPHDLIADQRAVPHHDPTSSNLTMGLDRPSARNLPRNLTQLPFADALTTFVAGEGSEGI